MSKPIALERALLGLFVASGFAGLIYQAIWSHYLGLSLGHAAYAQTLVLAIFMGGMALGAWIVSRYGVRWKRLILTYAVVEIVIGVAGLAFHPLFLGYTDLSQDTVYPALDSIAAVRAWQWGSAALMILPQCVLLGMTFPLMSGGYLRVAPAADGEILGGLYFSNSLGAAFGALFATFVLLPWIGMPGTVATAGVVNLAVGALAWVVARRVDDGGWTDGAPVATAAAPVKPAAADDVPYFRMMVVAAAITGATSFVYEIGWVRMLNQALGTTVHSFELMLAAFILGLAFGGLWVRRRAARIGDAVAVAGYAQVLMGVAALLSLPVFAQSFRWVGAMLGVLPRTEAGYALFSLGSAGIALAVMFPAAFFAGLTLPLFTMALLRRGAGEASIGRIYAANTLGAIAGVVLAVHVLIPALGLHLAVTLAALVDIALGFLLLKRYAENVTQRAYFASAILCLVVLPMSLLLGRTPPEALASGVFRTGVAALTDDTEFVFLRDGKTATVAVFGREGTAVIATNGKPDAGLVLDVNMPPSGDESTMISVGVLPLALHPDPRRIAVIGWGSGMTTHTLLGSDKPEVVDSIEIERAMYDGAMHFGRRVIRAYTDPRSRVHIDDARTFFSTGNRRYDVIVSEPSNPWVSGVASLFTRQFYGFLGRHLEDDGILVQWVQAYEIDDPLLATMLAALASEFPYIDLYRPNDGDVAVVASRKPLPPLHEAAEPGSPLHAELRRVGLGSVSDLAMRRVGTQAMIENFVRIAGVDIHDDFYPTVSLQAPSARFRRVGSFWITNLISTGMPVLEMTDGRVPLRPNEDVMQGRGMPDEMMQLPRVAYDTGIAMRQGTMPGVAMELEELARELERLRALSAAPVESADIGDWLQAAAVVAEFTIAHIAREDQVGVWIEPTWIDLDGQPEDVRAVMAAYDATARRDAPAMLAAGRAALPVVGPDAPPLLREHLLVIAMLGALASDQPAEALRLDREEGRGIPVGRDSNYGFIRSWLLAWADRPRR